MKKLVWVVTVILCSTNLWAKQLQYEGKFNLQPPYQGNFLLKVTVDVNESIISGVTYQGDVIDKAVGETYDAEDRVTLYKKACQAVLAANTGRATISILNSKTQEIVWKKPIDVHATFVKSSLDENDIANCKMGIFSTDKSKTSYSTSLHTNSTIEGDYPQEHTKIDFSYATDIKSDEVVVGYDQVTSTLMTGNMPAWPDVMNVNWTISTPDTNSLYMPSGSINYEEKLSGNGQLSLKK